MTARGLAWIRRSGRVGQGGCGGTNPLLLAHLQNGFVSPNRPCEGSAARRGNPALAVRQPPASRLHGFATLAITLCVVLPELFCGPPIQRSSTKPLFLLVFAKWLRFAKPSLRGARSAPWQSNPLRDAAAGLLAELLHFVRNDGWPGLARAAFSFPATKRLFPYSAMLVPRPCLQRPSTV